MKSLEELAFLYKLCLDELRFCEFRLWVAFVRDAFESCVCACCVCESCVLRFFELHLCKLRLRELHLMMMVIVMTIMTSHQFC